MKKQELFQLPDANLENTKELARLYKHKYIIKMNYNENKFGPSPLVKKNIKLLSPHIYPEYKDDQILNLFKKEFNIDYENILFSNGSDSILDHLPKIFGYHNEKSNAIIPNLTYGRIEVTCKILDLSVKKIELNNKWEIDLEETLKSIDKDTTMIYVVNPNMPTGHFISFKKIEEFLNKVPKHITIVLDHAYIEYAMDVDVKKIFKQELSLIKKFKNLIITKTFSKLFGLASFRIGYCLSDKDNITLIRKTLNYLPISKYSYQAAFWALQDIEFYKEKFNILQDQKKYLYNEFDKLNIKYLKTSTNFIFIYDLSFNIDKLYNYLLKNQGILIRKIKDNLGIRITIGTSMENKKLIKGIKEFLCSE